MTDSPFRERRIPPDEVQRIVRRATELARSASTAEKGGTALTAEELEQKLAELGIPSDVARRAMEPPAPAIEPAADGAVRVVRELEIEGKLGPEHFEAIADAIASVMKVPGQVSVVGGKLTWVPGGLLREPTVTVHVKGGITRISYVETLANRGQVWFGFGTLASFAGVLAGTGGTVAGAAIAKAAEVSAGQGAPMVLALGGLVGVAAAVGSFLGLKRVLARRAVVRTAFADQVMSQVAEAVHASLEAKPPRARVEPDEASALSEREIADETELELGESGAARARVGGSD